MFQVLLKLNVIAECGAQICYSTPNLQNSSQFSGRAQAGIRKLFSLASVDRSAGTETDSQIIYIFSQIFNKLL